MFNSRAVMARVRRPVHIHQRLRLYQRGSFGKQHTIELNSFHHLGLLGDLLIGFCVDGLTSEAQCHPSHFLKDSHQISQQLPLCGVGLILIGVGCVGCP